MAGGRPATGSPTWRLNRKTGAWQWFARVTISKAAASASTTGKGRRRWVALDPNIAREDEAAARACALEASNKARGIGVPGETVESWFGRYYEAAAKGLVGKKNRGRPQVTSKARQARFKNWIAPVIGNKVMGSVTADDLKAIVNRLDDQIRIRAAFYRGEGKRDAKRGTKPGLAAKTAWNVWGEVTAGFAEACSSKIAGLCVLKVDPTTNVQGPNHADDRVQAALYSSELALLLACELIPLRRRRLWALAAYTGLRMSECRGLRKHDVDFEHGVIVVTRQQKDSNEKTTTQLKTSNSRRSIKIHPHLEPLLRVLVAEARPNGAIVHVPPREDCGELVRKDLRTAGCERAALHTDDDVTLHFTAHGLRHTCITHWAVAGEPLASILGWAGHSDAKTTQRYLDLAASARSTFGEPHPPLPSSLFETTLGSFGSVSAFASARSEIPQGIPAILRPQWESNPCYRRERPMS